MVGGHRRSVPAAKLLEDHTLILGRDAEAKSIRRTVAGASDPRPPVAGHGARRFARQQSYVAALFAIVPAAAIALRILLEERSGAGN